jgi:hypothetical protein
MPRASRIGKETSHNYQSIDYHTLVLFFDDANNSRSSTQMVTIACSLLRRRL